MVQWFESDAMWFDSFLNGLKTQLESAIVIINSDSCPYSGGEIDTTVLTHFPNDFFKKISFGIDISNIQIEKISDEKPGGSVAEIQLYASLRINYGNIKSKEIEIHQQRVLANLITSFINNEIETITESGVRWTDIYAGQVNFEVLWINGNYGLEIEITAKTTIESYIV